MDHPRKRPRLMTPQERDDDPPSDALDIDHGRAEHVKRHSHGSTHGHPRIEGRNALQADAAAVTTTVSSPVPSTVQLVDSTPPAGENAPVPLVIPGNVVSVSSSMQASGISTADIPTSIETAGACDPILSSASIPSVIFPFSIPTQPVPSVNTASILPSALPSAVSGVISGITSALNTAIPALPTSVSASDASSNSTLPTSSLALNSTLSSSSTAGTMSRLSNSTTSLLASTSSAMSLVSTSSSLSDFIPSTSVNSLSLASTSASSIVSSTSVPTTSSPTSGNTASPAASDSSVDFSGSASRGGNPTTSSAAPAASLTQNQNDNNNDSGPATPQLVGGVVGGIAGLTILLVIALLFLRWFKRRKNAAAAAALGTGTTERGLHAPGGGRGPPGVGPEMSEQHSQAVAAAVPTGAVGASAAGAAAAGGGGFMRRLSRAKQQPPPAVPAETGFQRLSGRKLPSQFSPGMEGPSVAAASSSAAPNAAFLSGVPSSHYPSGGTWLSSASSGDPFQDPHGSVSPPGFATLGAAAASDARRETLSPSEREKFMSGPVRTPHINTPQNTRTSHMGHIQSSSPPGSPFAGRPGLSRSPASVDSRMSRFQEEV